MKGSILVTGGAGYIGSHTAKALALAGYRPVVIDDFSNGNLWAVRWGPLVRGDFADALLLRQTITKFDIDAVIHFAASASVGESMQNPRKYFGNNLLKSQILLDTLLDCKVNKLIFSSSCAVYGIPGEAALITEGQPQAPINPYGETKLAFEKMCRWYSQAYPLRSVCLRYFNAAGADSDGDLGECHDPETHLIPLAIAAAQGNGPALTVFGTDFDTPDGTAVRDFVHVSDIADAHLAALTYLEQNGPNTVANLGTGKGVSVHQVLRRIEAISGTRVPFRVAPRRLGDPPKLVASAQQAARLFNWTPYRSDLDNIIQSAWQWADTRLPQRLPALAE